MRMSGALVALVAILVGAIAAGGPREGRGLSEDYPYRAFVPGASAAGISPEIVILPPPLPGLDIVNADLRDLPSGGTVLIGEVRNNTNAEVGELAVGTKTYGPDGAFLVSGGRLTLTHSVPPGATTPFVVGVGAAPGVQVARHEVRVGPNYDIPPFTPHHPGLEVTLGASFVDEQGATHQPWTVTNTSATFATYVEVVVVWYDASGKPLWGRSCYAYPSQLGPGESGSYETLYQLPGEPASVRTWTTNATSWRNAECNGPSPHPWPPP